jgi:pyruvate dehydrogenase E1 component beta subunit
MAELSFVEAARAGLAEEMARDPAVWALGEDVAYGGLYGQYKGLAERFGAARLVSTPISEAMIMGVGLGAALVGTRPVIEMRIADFALCAWDELVNQIAKIRYMCGGQCAVPLVVRMPQGLLRSAAAQHSQSLEAYLVHTPGLVVVAPATPADAKGLLKAAIRSDDPVVVLEPKALWQSSGTVPDGEHIVPIGAARVARHGGDVTLITWSALLPVALAAAGAVATRGGLSTEVIDLRSLWPWDRETVLASVARTGRVVIAHEAVRVGGFGAELFATIAEAGVVRSPAAMRRVGAPRIPVPFSPPLEAMYRVSQEQIEDALHAVAAAPPGARTHPDDPPCTARNTNRRQA